MVKKKKNRRSGASSRLWDTLLNSLDPGGTGSGMPDRSAIIFLSVLLFVLLVAFLHRAFHIDDPLFIWAARHIQAHPGNPYGFAVNWYGASMPISDVAKNPPLASYYIALAAVALGWSEPALHLAFITTAVAVGIGTYLIAGRLCAHPLLA